MCNSAVEPDLETQRVSSGERGGEEEVGKEGRKKSFGKTVAPLL